MVQHGVVAVVEPFTGQARPRCRPSSGRHPLHHDQRGVDRRAHLAGAYAIEGGFPAYLGAEALSAKQHGFTKVALLVENVPAAIQGAQALGGIVFKAAGVGYTVVPSTPARQT